MMDTINNWLKLAKKHKVEVVNVSVVDEPSLCVNLLSIPETDAVAITVTVMEQQKKKNALPPWKFAKVIGVFERILRDIDGNYIQSSPFFKPVPSETLWYRVLNCHRIFFIPETSVPDFISSFLSRNRLNVIKSSGVDEIFWLANTIQYNFGLSV